MFKYQFKMKKKSFYRVNKMTLFHHSFRCKNPHSTSTSLCDITKGKFMFLSFICWPHPQTRCWHWPWTLWQVRQSTRLRSKFQPFERFVCNKAVNRGLNVLLAGDLLQNYWMNSSVMKFRKTKWSEIALNITYFNVKRDSGFSARR